MFIVVVTFRLWVRHSPVKSSVVVTMLEPANFASAGVLANSRTAIVVFGLLLGTLRRLRKRKPYLEASITRFRANLDVAPVLFYDPLYGV